MASPSNDVGASSSHTSPPAPAAAVVTATGTILLPRVTIQFCTQCKWLLRAAYVRCFSFWCGLFRAKHTPPPFHFVFHFPFPISQTLFCSGPPEAPIPSPHLHPHAAPPTPYPPAMPLRPPSPPPSPIHTPLTHLYPHTPLPHLDPPPPPTYKPPPLTIPL